jgi:signal transduction histidine kinase
LDNALKVSPRGTTITVQVRVTPAAGILVVSDEGPGLDDEKKKRALERFWRGDQSGPGSGLGLAIVAALVRASDGEVKLGDSPSGGLSVEVSLPLSP